MSLGELKPVAGRGVFVQKQRANVYTMMLVLSFLFIVIGCLALYMEMRAYNMQVKVPAQYTAAQAKSAAEAKAASQVTAPTPP